MDKIHGKEIALGAGEYILGGSPLDSKLLIMSKFFSSWNWT